MNGYLEAVRRQEYARETHEMALALYGRIFPPWRWVSWVRGYREVRRRLRLQRSWQPLT